MIIMIFGLSSITMILDLIFEITNIDNSHEKEVNWSAYLLSMISYVSSWVPIVTYSAVNASNNILVEYMSVVVLLTFTLDLGIQLLLGISWKYRNEVPYVYSEMAFILFSFLGKVLFAWVTYGAE